MLQDWILPQWRDAGLQVENFVFIDFCQCAHTPDIVDKHQLGDVEDAGLSYGVNALGDLVIIFDNFVKEVAFAIATGCSANGLSTTLVTAERVSLGRFDLRVS